MGPEVCETNLTSKMDPILFSSFNNNRGVGFVYMSDGYEFLVETMVLILVNNQL